MILANVLHGLDGRYLLTLWAVVGVTIATWHWYRGRL